MFDAFGIDFGDGRGHAERYEEGDHFAVAFAACGGLFAALGRQEDGSIGFGVDEAFLAKALQSLGDGDVRDAQPVGHIDAAGLSAFAYQVVDQFHIIFGGFIGVMHPGSAKPGGLAGGPVGEGARGPWLGFQRFGHRSIGFRPISHTRAGLAAGRPPVYDVA